MEVWQSWSIAAVLKTVELKGSVGSNPTASAKKRFGNMKFISYICQTIAEEDLKESRLSSR
jgi:hypothetical protein